MRDDQVSITLSVLDRLLDDPSGPGASGPARGHSVNDLRAAVRRDLEDLLNTYRRATGWPKPLTELRTSLVAYGVPDMLAENLATVDRRRQVVAELQAAIEKWEPRLTNLAVRMLENVDPSDRTLRFRIEAEIRADPALEPVVFDSVVDPTSNVVQVMRTARG